MANLAGIFVTFELEGTLRERIASVQSRHDPRLARLWPPHVTLIGSSGVGPILPDTTIDTLRSLLEPVTRAARPITQQFGAPQRFPDRDIVALPLDPHGPLRALHDGLARTGIRTYTARYPFTPHCTLTMYPPLTRERERELTAMRFDEAFEVRELLVYLTRDPQPAKLLMRLPLGGG